MPPIKTAPAHADLDLFRGEASDGVSPGEALRASLKAPAAVAVQDVLELERSHDKRVLFSNLVLEEATKLPDKREELSRRPRVGGVTLTIDSYRSQDLDDGLSFRREADGTMVVGVSAADVSCWIRPGSALDHTARLRVESRYMGDDVVVPMLPLPLSEGLLSLHHGEPRLTKTIEMRFDPDGTLRDHRVFRSVFVNQHRLDKDDATAARSGQGHGAEDPALADALVAMSRIADKLNGGKGDALPSMARMLEAFIRASCLVLAKDLEAAGLHTSYRNQAVANAKSVYGKDPEGHVAVGADAYVQWTSAIRRYSDLDVHRAMDLLIDGKQPAGRVTDIDNRMRDVQLTRANGEPPPKASFMGVLTALINAKLAGGKPSGAD